MNENTDVKIDDSNEKLQYKNKLVNYEHNTVSTALKVIAWVVLISGIIISLSASGDNPYAIFIVVLSYIVSFAVLLGLSSIIQILHDMRQKNWSK